MQKGHINANLPRQVNFLLSGNIAGQNRNSAENCLNPSLNDTMARNTACSRNSVPNDSDQHEQRLINLENQVAHLTRCFSEQNEVTNYIANVNSHLVSENDRLKDAVGDVNNRLRHIQVSLNAHQMKHDDHQANFNTLQNQQSNQSVELARLARLVEPLVFNIHMLRSYKDAYTARLADSSFINFTLNNSSECS